MAELLKKNLEENGLKVRDIGNTFTSDIIQKNGNIASSAIDHIYVSKELEENTFTCKLNSGSSDHVPIVAIIDNGKTVRKMKTLTKRNTKLLTKESWNQNLIMKNWENLCETDNIDEMAEKMNEHIIAALDQCAPVKTFKIRNQNKHGISNHTKTLISERNLTRKKMKDATHSEKVILHEKFKRLRNKVNSELKKDTIRNNNERIDKANDENEVWKIVKEISSPNRNKHYTECSFLASRVH